MDMSTLFDVFLAFTLRSAMFASNIEVFVV